MSELISDLEASIEALVDAPDEVEVMQVGKGYLELRVDPDDLGRVIGRQGRTIRALRTLLDTRGQSEDIDYWLEIIED